jgi:uncharacterized protein YceK
VQVVAEHVIERTGQPVAGSAPRLHLGQRQTRPSGSQQRGGEVLPALGSLTPGGCGTFFDAICGPRQVSDDGRIIDPPFYRGVRFDLLAIQEGGQNVLLAADLTFSAIADTLLVPSIAIACIAYLELTASLPRAPRTTSDEPATAEQGGSAPPARVAPKE